MHDKMRYFLGKVTSERSQFTQSVRLQWKRASQMVQLHLDIYCALPNTECSRVNDRREGKKRSPENAATFSLAGLVFEMRS